LNDNPAPDVYMDIAKRYINWLNAGHINKIIDNCHSSEHLFRLPFTNNCKDLNNIRPVEIIESNDIGYTIDDFQALIPANFNPHCCGIAPTVKPVSKKQTKKVISELPVFLKKWWKKYKAFDRSAKTFKVIAGILSHYPAISDTTIFAACKKDKDIYGQAGHWKSETALRKDIATIRQKVKAQAVKPMLPVEKIAISADYDLSHLEPARQQFDLKRFSSRGKKFDITLAVMDKLYKSKASGILSLPCASGKTYSALIYIASIASPDKRIWLVSEKISDCIRNFNVLKAMGINASAFHGMDREICQHKDNKQFWTDRKKHCQNCVNKCGAELKYISGQPYDYVDADIVCCTHQNYSSALSAGQLPALDLIITDESPNLLETFSYKKSQLAVITTLLNRSHEKQAIFEADILYNIEEKLLTGGGKKIIPLQLMNYESEIKKYMFSQLDSGFISESDAEFVLDFLNFFKNRNIYGYRGAEKHIAANGDKKVETFNFMCGQVNISTNIQTIILDGSARNQSVKWNGFKIYECDELRVNNPNTTIHCLSHNPSQAKIANSTVFGALSDIALNIIKGGEQVLIFSNKQMNKKIQSQVANLIMTIAGKGCSITYLPRGQHIGSNKGMAAESTIITMSLFTTVADYVLRACVFNDTDIAHEEIFNEQGMPKFNKNGHWDNAMIQDQYIRTLERDLYQAILRGCIRNNPATDYNVIALISSPEIISTLQEDLPDAKIVLSDEPVIQMYLDGKSEPEICKATKLAQQTVNDAIKAFQKIPGLGNQAV